MGCTLDAPPHIYQSPPGASAYLTAIVITGSTGGCRNYGVYAAGVTGLWSGWWGWSQWYHTRSNQSAILCIRLLRCPAKASGHIPPPTHPHPTHGASFSDVHDVVIVVVATTITVKQHFGGFLGVSKTDLLAYLRILKPPWWPYLTPVDV